MELGGLHHVTAVTANAPQNLDFYTNTLGLRLVKKTVNQDDVSAYHLFYGDEVGGPGTEVTFFDWAGMGPNLPGSGGIVEIGLRVPEDCDGQPMQAIDPGQTKVYEFQLIDRACPAWFHPHPMGLTAHQVVMGMAGLFSVWDDQETSVVPGAAVRVYGKVATGFRPPSIQGRILFCADFQGGTNPATNCVSVAKEEKLTSYEVVLVTPKKKIWGVDLAPDGKIVSTEKKASENED